MSPVMMEHDPIQRALDERLPLGLGGPWFGVYPALVTSIRDPDARGRVQVSFAWAPDVHDADGGVWARVATLMAGKDRGSWFIPDEGDEVLVAFEGGNPSRPFVVGALWNGEDTSPETMDGQGQNNIKCLVSRNGVSIRLDDQDGQESLILETPGGQKVTLKDGPGRINLEDSNGNAIKLESTGITITAATTVTVNASHVSVSAGMVTVDAGMSKFSGVVMADTVIANSVVASSYTPGAGNVW